MSDLKKERKKDTKQKKEIWKPNDNINEVDERKKMERIIEQAKKAGYNEYDEMEKMKRILEKAKIRSRDSQSDIEIAKKIMGAMDKKYRLEFIEKPRTEYEERNEKGMVFTSNIKVEHPERKSDIPEKKNNKPEQKKLTEKKDKIKENREKEKKKEPEREKRENTKEKQKTREINREQEEQKKVKEKESNESEKIKEKKSKNIDTKKKQDISSEKNIISEPKKERDRKIEKKKVSKDNLEKHKEIKDITNKINDLEKRRNENSNLIDFCKKKLKEGNFDGIITCEGHEQKLKELIKKNEQIEKQLREFNNNSSHSEIINNEKLRVKKGEVLEKRNTELKQKQKNENLKEEEQISREKAKELGRNLPNRGKQKQEKQKEIPRSKERIPEEKKRYIELDRKKDKSEEKIKSESFSMNDEKKELTSEKQKSQDIKREGEKTDQKQEKKKEENWNKILRKKTREKREEQIWNDPETEGINSDMLKLNNESNDIESIRSEIKKVEPLKEIIKEEQNQEDLRKGLKVGLEDDISTHTGEEDFKNFKIPEDLFYKRKNGYHCKDVNLLKKIYEIQKSFPRTELYLKNQDYKNIPSSSTIKRLIQKSFKSKLEYKTWRCGIRLREIQDIVKERGGECLSSEYKNSRSKLSFRCKNGHEFEVTPNNLKLYDYWCPTCLSSEYENCESKDYINLMDSELQCYFKEYSDKTGRKPNWGIYVTSDLKNFLENHEKIPNTVKVELMNRISKINKNLEIVNFIKNQIKSAKLSQHEIISISRKMGLGMSKKTIKTARMLKRKREMSDYKRNAIIKDATAIDHDSGSKLIRKYKIGKKTFKDILIEAKGEKWYEKKYHAYERISSEKRRDMIKAATVKGHGSLPSLSREFKVDCQTYKKLLIEAKGKDWVEEEYPTLSEILSKKRKDIIKAGTAKNHPSLTKLSEMFNVSIGSIKKILEEEKGEEYVI